MDVRETNRRVIEQFRAGGPVEGMHRDRLVLLTTAGRRTGRPHTTPMMFHRDDDVLLVVASNIGAPQHPDWYLNLVVDPAVDIEIDGERYPGAAEALEGDRREETWAMLTDTYPFFADHETRTERTIPVVALRRS
jgi:deazaflavin-dependent oxidoreductase (nitroreductase family)